MGDNNTKELLVDKYINELKKYQSEQFKKDYSNYQLNKLYYYTIKKIFKQNPELIMRYFEKYMDLDKKINSNEASDNINDVNKVLSELIKSIIVDYEREKSISKSNSLYVDEEMKKMKK